MMYCSDCMAVAGQVCECCGNKKTRPLQKEDPVYLTTKEKLLSGGVEDVLTENGIVYLKRGELGTGLANRIGFAFERYHFFVAYENYEEAKKLLERIP